jgi:hypothetical protein
VLGSFQKPIPAQQQESADYRNDETSKIEPANITESEQDSEKTTDNGADYSDNYCRDDPLGIVARHKHLGEHSCDQTKTNPRYNSHFPPPDDLTAPKDLRQSRWMLS